MKTIVIAGNVGKDAVLRTTQKGDHVLGFGVAVDDGWGDNKRTLWFDVSVWGKRAERLAPHVTKGSKVAVSGDLSTREHDGKTYLTVRANEITLQGGNGAGSEPNRSQSGAGGGDGGGSVLDDEVPF